MKTQTTISIWILPVIICAAMTFSAQSNAAVTVTFSQVGTDVHAVWSGSLNAGAFLNDDPFVQSLSATNGLIFANGLIDVFNQGFHENTSLTGTISSVTGLYASFGFRDTFFVIEGIENNMADSFVIDFSASNSVMIYENQTLASIGATGFNNTLAWTSSAGGTNTVRYTIPEVSSLVLFGFGGLGLFFRRRR